jgi:sugar phosphate permease
MQDFRGFTLLCAVGFLSGILYYSSLILWPLQVSALYATTTVKIGEYGMCYGWGALLGSVVAGFIIQRVNQARITLTAITLFLTIVIGTSAIVGMSSSSLMYWVICCMY